MLRRLFHQFGVALQFLTTFPVQVSEPVTDDDLRRSMMFYPAVGTSLGLLLSGIGGAVGLVLPASVTAIGIVAVSVVATGNLHVDGLMDTADGLFGAFDRKKRLRIMKDSRSGAHGVVAAILALTMKAALIASASSIGLSVILPVAATWSRWSLVLAAARFPYARSEGGLGSALIGRIERRFVAAATLIAVAVTALILSDVLSVIVVLSISSAVTFFMGSYIGGKIDGMTGDTLGALHEMVELAVLAVLVATV